MDTMTSLSFYLSFKLFVFVFIFVFFYLWKNMPIYRYNRYRRRYRPYRRYFRRYIRRRFRRYVNGSSKSSIRVKVPISLSLSWTQAANTQGTGVSRVCPLDDSSSYASAMNSALYRTYCDLYDEVKIIGMKCKLNISSQVGGQDIPSLQIYTAFDRRHGVNEPNPTFTQLKTYSTFSVATAVNNSVAKLQRSLYASDLLEKAQWHDCTLALAGGVYSDAAYVSAADNPNFFVPAMFICMAIPNVTVNTTVNGTLDCMYYFSFRNPKYGASAASRGDSFTLSRVPALPDGGPGDMDDGIPDTLPIDVDLDQEDVDAAASASASAPAPLVRAQRSLGIQPKKKNR